ncbi:MAG: hypothetical protein JNL11_02280 [Bdellovibrionaceae bacterium]|nr:hypothetical protein [Pseudobdellovibrionaceae bacterium]
MLWVFSPQSYRLKRFLLTLLIYAIGFVKIKNGKIRMEFTTLDKDLAKEIDVKYVTSEVDFDINYDSYQAR